MPDSVALRLDTAAPLFTGPNWDYTGLRRYAHIGTGNYHPGTARLYADYGLLTCDEVIGQDLTQLFNYLTTGYAPGRTYKKILPAPNFLKPALLAKIDREIVAKPEALGEFGLDKPAAGVMEGAASGAGAV